MKYTGTVKRVKNGYITVMENGATFVTPVNSAEQVIQNTLDAIASDVRALKEGDTIKISVETEVNP